ncbi:hypothetical protein GCM10011507_03120 [Edaphobacter acidisoli]|uniref:ChbG/HpnK family deacetylase n=1 Tax=Edaphobacter acidisoli TaxID=2040573 RepID=A0A916REY6_9BACT|nr:hypothetical protein GCM10011507_03120 [Edaphobacter acidisoli]
MLTSATLMATGNVFDDAVVIARANPALGVGCHVVLTDGHPVSPPHTIPSLLGRDGKSFRPSLLDFVQALVRGGVREDEIEREALAQIEKLQRAGIRVTHLDSHKHTHLFPAVTRPLLRAAERTGIFAIRNPFEQSWSVSLGRGHRLRQVQVRLLRTLHSRFDHQPPIHSGKVRTTSGTIGISATGDLDTSTLCAILRALPKDSTEAFELCCHPGYNDSDLDRVTTRLRSHRDIERKALLTEIPARLLHPNAPRLIHYGELAEAQGACTTDSRCENVV